MDTTSTNLPSLHPISVKLDRTNYNFWKTQVYATACAYGFNDLLLRDTAPSPTLSSTFDAESISNPEYLAWLRKDQFSKARAAQLRLQLQTLKKGDSSIDDYILKFRGISDQLHNIGQAIPESDLVNYVLAGLGPEYESVSVFLQARCEELSVDDTQFALQTHEIRLLNQSTAANTTAFTASSTQQQPNHQANIAYNQQNQRGRGGRSSNRSSGNRGGRGGGDSY
ncbi:uncharacterized protein LOC131026024 [Salvia miltiorrhiza]|uniref:uncharacterized protein LOC131026024 n=1 Tax=Salvia miltiorrhiza TaxID=226208 RepID=UPI0025ABEA64|nr:uncharacterized protein LOC131026024 [Salvia miltiorrhiza]